MIGAVSPRHDHRVIITRSSRDLDRLLRW